MSAPIEPIGELTWSLGRRAEPITIGVPIPSGLAHSSSAVTVEDHEGRRQPAQVRPLDLWPDGSIRWALVDCLIDATAGRAKGVVLRFGDSAATASAETIVVTSLPGAVRISTGRATFGFSVGGRFPVSEVVTPEDVPIAIDASGLEIEHEGVVHRCRISAVHLQESGPIRAAIEVHALIEQSSELPLAVFARIETFVGTATLRISVTIRNVRRAKHANGHWTLGDPGSVLLGSVALVLQFGHSITRVQCALEWGAALSDVQMPLEIHQESSGGDHWKSDAHRNRLGRVALRFRGYRRREGEREGYGERATPIVVADTAHGSVSLAIPKFWQNFPRAISVRDGRIEVGLFPRQSEEPHELQGGEQKTHVVVLTFGQDRVSDPPLAWVHDPVVAYPRPDWCCDSGAVPFLVTAKRDRDERYLDLVASALDPENGFARKRELADEYGWRNFGDLPADHESVFLPPGQLHVSHYNNQYDALGCFALHFLRTGDPRWWHLMADLAAHVRDVDLYHTDQDKAAYNGGLFWHTWHYFDAGTSTHRSYPTESPASGGPSAEHNYNFGLMLHYFMTGESASRTEAINLGNWVVEMDLGRRSVFRWLAGGPTGYASGSGSINYHGPGRGAANSILACMVAHRLTGDSRFEAKVEQLIRRCIHPADDIESRDLRNVEQRWFYTVFLQVLGRYLHDKSERLAFDDTYFYARESLLHYARWMVAHERPYLDQREQLEYPNETWAAQDLRKADVLLWAAGHADGAERDAFLSRAAFFRDHSIQTLSEMPTHRFTRPTVLVLANGIRLGWFQDANLQRLPGPASPPNVGSWGRPTAFVPQRIRALRRARWVVAAVFVTVLAWAALALTTR